MCSFLSENTLSAFSLLTKASKILKQYQLKHTLHLLVLLLVLIPAHLPAETKDQLPLANKDFVAAPENVKNKHSFITTGSSVNTVTRNYQRDHEDISVTFPGGRFSVHRYYENGAWHWNHDQNNLGFKYDGEGKIDDIIKAGVSFEGSGFDPNLFKYATQRILKTDTGFKWLDSRDNWIVYDDKGRLTSYGKRTRTTAIALYSGENCIGWTDPAGTRLFWFEYTGNTLTAVTDAANRRIEYTYENELLKTVTNLRGFVTTFSYADKKLTRVVEPGGKIVNIAYGPYGDVVSVTDDKGIGHFFEFDYDKGTREYYAYTRFPSGKVKEVWYDYDGDTKRVDVNGTTIQSIKSDGRTQWVTDARGFITRQELDEWDNIIKTVYPDESWVENTYQQPGNFLIQVNRMGIKTTYEYDEFGNRIAENRAVGTPVAKRTEFTFNSDGRARTQTMGESGAQDSTTAYDYDLSGHVISITDPEYHPFFVGCTPCTVAFNAEDSGSQAMCARRTLQANGISTVSTSLKM